MKSSPETKESFLFPHPFRAQGSAECATEDGRDKTGDESLAAPGCALVSFSSSHE